MNTRTILTIVLISFSGIAAILPDMHNSSSELKGQELLEELQLGTYKIDPYRLSGIIIEKDPSYMLIDIRPYEEFEKFSLPGAINIPFDSLFNEGRIAYIDQDLRNNIFYSNGSTLASVALLLTRQRGFKNNFALDGGLNGWFDLLLNTEIPVTAEDQHAFSLYQRRLAIQQYFKGGNITPAKSLKNELMPVPVRKKTKVQGGCS